MASGSAKYYVVFEDGEWKAVVSDGYTDSTGKTVLRTFDTKPPAVEYAKGVAKNNNEALMVNFKSGETGQQYYDYS